MTVAMRRRSTIQIERRRGGGRDKVEGEERCQEETRQNKNDYFYREITGENHRMRDY